jgi:hypothetical protein
VPTAGVRVTLRVRDGLVDALAVRGGAAPRVEELVGRRFRSPSSAEAGANPADIPSAILAGTAAAP